ILRDRLTRRGLSLSAVLAAVEISQETVPAALVISTARTAITFAAGSVVSVAAKLAEGALKGMLLSKRKIGATLVLSIGLVGLGAGLIAHQIRPEKLELPSTGAKPEKPEAAEQARRDQFGDPLPDGAVSRLGTVRFDHGNGLHGLYFSPDGKTILSQGQGALRFWEATT